MKPEENEDILSQSSGFLNYKKMANFNLYFPKLINDEGEAYENDPLDSGGCTKMGLTLDDIIEVQLDVNGDNKFTCDDVKLLTLDKAKFIFKKLYWDFFKADLINNQSLAELIVEGGINQGRLLTAKYAQSAVGVTPDGIFGKNTLNALNTGNQQQIFDKIFELRKQRYYNIVAAKPSQKRFIKGWINRLNRNKFIQ
jgi:lysozyme family protein